ncbi:MAG: hypothetical protein R2698_11540 [Microthrixaceae bacterium]
MTTPRQYPLDGVTWCFATGGASGHQPADTPDAMALAIRLGAGGIETTARLTRDGVVVFRESARVGGFRRRSVDALTSAELPPDVARAEGLLSGAASVSASCRWLVHVDPTTASPVCDLVDMARAADRVWLVSGDRELLVRLCERVGGSRLVAATTPATAGSGLERFAATLREHGIGGVQLSHADWSGGRTALFHRFGRRCIAAGAVHTRMIVPMLHIGVDAVCTTHPDRFVDALGELGRGVGSERGGGSASS